MSPLIRHLRWCAVAACAVAALAPAGGAGAAAPPTLELTALELTALTGPAGADLYVKAPGGTTALEILHVRVGNTEDPQEEPRILNLKDVPIVNGVATVDLGDEAAGTPVRVDAVDLDLLAGSATIRGFTLANPPGYSDAAML
ncbi:MAG TPA: hypothetical protein VFV62_09760, partial [Gaiellaceae bacterium]|nr:hypothetical protein [Gaiellaceae bacterium]